MIEPAFRKLLLDDIATAALIGTRVFFGTLPQNERRDSIVLTLIDDEHQQLLSEHAGHSKGRMQADCFATTYEGAKKLARAAGAAIDNFEGTVTLPDASSIDVGYIKAVSLRDVPAAPLEGQSLPLYGVSIDAMFLVLGGFA